MSEQIRIPTRPEYTISEKQVKPDCVKYVSDGIEKEIPIVVEQESTSPKINRIITFSLAVIIIAFFFIIESNILNLPYEYRAYLLGPYLQVLHEWIVFTKHIYTFLKTVYPNNALTTTFEKIIVYVVDKTLPYESWKTYVKTAPQTVALRPHLRNIILYLLESSKTQTPENEQTITILMKISDLSNDASEIRRILGIERGVLQKLSDEKDNYNDLLHFINNYTKRFDQFMKYFNGLFDAGLKGNIPEFGAASSDFELARVFSDFYQQIINMSDALQEEFNKEGPTIEEINGGKRKTRRRKTLSKKHRKQKTSSKKNRKQNSNRKRRNTRIVYQKLNRLAKFLLI
jgi:hypothetical protein